MIYLLDTDAFTLAYHGTHGVRDRIDAARRGGDEVAVGLVTRLEVLRGRIDAVLKAADGAGLLRAARGLAASEALLATYRAVPIDAAAADRYDQLRGDKKLRKVRAADMLQACIALANGATLVTRNTKDYVSVPGLVLDDWAA